MIDSNHSGRFFTCRRRFGRFAIASLAAAGLSLLAACGPAADEQAPAGPVATAEATYVGGGACIDCHADAAEAWQTSHHDLAMQVTDESTVLGDFDGATFEHDGTTSEFFRRDGNYFVRTKGPDGDVAEFRITHTFGIDPLQQYLVELPGGHYQVLTMAWDTRPATNGGQRWFSVQPAEQLEPGDPLHWSGVFQSWNSSCAGCHSTNLEKNYAPASDTFATTWSSIDVDCEACHGPGSLHAAEPERWPMALSADREAKWVFEPGEAIATRVPARTSDEQIETCAQCHARRGQLVDRFEAGTPLMQAFRPALLEEGLYHADGQIMDEVYVYGSFLQSKMYAAGVTCSDCHDPHSSELRADGNAVCAQCHLASEYETAAHHHHEPGTAGSACVDCHMPAKTYMVVDPRRDHSFRVPRPDLAVEIDAPDACTGCHADQDAGWAADRVRAWYPDGRSDAPHYGQAIAAARRWDRDWAPGLLEVAGDETQPAIVRATAVRLLSRQPTAAFPDTMRAAVADEALVKLAAADALAGLPEGPRLELGQRLLSGSPLAVRTTAARQLLSMRNTLPQSRRAMLDDALDEYRDIQRFNSDRPEGWNNLAGLHRELGELAEAEAALETAIERFPWSAAAWVSLADLYRQTGRDPEATTLLERATAASPDDPSTWLALGFAKVRAGESAESIGHIRKAVELAPDEPYYHYVLGVALHSAATPDEAIDVLVDAHERFPGYRDITFALATMSRDQGDYDAALGYARQLVDDYGADPRILNLVRELEAAREAAD